jgi:uncharacterized membrane protein YraQ (UPF0718 family)
LDPSTPLTAAAFFLATVIGALPPVARRWGDRSLHLFIALSAGVFLGTVFLHILPELAAVAGGGEAAGHGHDHGHGLGELAPWATALAGFLGLFLLEKVWLRGYELRHQKDPHRLVWVSTYIALSLHAFAGGLGLAAIEQKWLVLLPILWHKLTEAFSLTTVLRLSGVPSGRSWLLIALFALATPLGYLAGDTVLHLGGGLEAVLIGLAGGTFVYVAACDLLPEVFHQVDQPGPRVSALLVGVLAAGLFPHHATADLGGGFFVELLLASWEVFVEMAPYLLLGFLVAGLLSQWLDPARLSRWIARDDLRSVGVASIVGAPLPLCSCSVVPVAASLRGAGAGKGATSAFLVATPETGVDSISVTYGLLDPLMTVVRPVASVLSAIVTGLAVNLFVRSGADDEPGAGRGGAAPASCCESAAEEGEPRPAEASRSESLLRRALRYAFVDMLDDLGGALLLGVLLSGVIGVALPESLFEERWLDGPGGLLVMLAVGIPVYVCAASSTPIAASLILKGLSPGAALVFLLAGPSTNLATLAVMTRYLGRRVVVVHVAVLAAVTLALGFATDALYAALEVTPSARLGHEHGGAGEWLGVASAALLLALLCGTLWRRYLADGDGEACVDHEH